MHRNHLRKITFVLLLLLFTIYNGKVFAQTKLDSNAIKANIKTITDSLTINAEYAKELATINLKASNDIKYPWGIFMNTLALGSIAYNNGEREEAIKMHEEVLAYGRKHGFNGDTKKAINLYHEAAKIAQEINDSIQLGSALQGLGQTYSAIGYSEEAIQYCSQAAAIFIKYNRNSTLRYSYNHIAAAYMDLSKFDSAYKYIWLSKHAYDASGARAPQMDFYLNMALCTDSLNMPDSSLYYFEKAITAARTTKDEIGLQSALTYLAMKVAASGKTHEAIKLYKEALVLTEKYNNIEGCMSITGSLAQLYAKINDYKNAYAYSLQYSDYTEQYINEEKITAVTALNSKFEKQQLQHEFDTKTAATALENQKKIAKRNMLIYGFIALALLLGIVIFFVVKYFRQKAVITANKNEQLKQRLLLTQMNPHFIFNSVDNIQSLIYNGKEDDAINYLTKFSKLTRQILENSRENYISLDEEVNMLDNYMNIQKLLYNNNFTYKVIVDEDIDPESVLLPPMLTQPFIENAIKHGLKSKNEDGWVQVRFYMKQDQLFFEVTDNGTGLIEKQVQNGHKSLSTQITKERLDSIASKKKIVIETANIFGENNIIQGVKTFFEIPYVFNT